MHRLVLRRQQGRQQARATRSHGRTAELRFLFGEAVKNARLAHGWTQEKLAMASGFPRTYLSAIEHGHKVVTIETAQSIALALEMPASALIARAEALVSENT